MGAHTCGDSGMDPTCVLSARQGVLFGQAARDQAEGNGSSKHTYGHLLSRGATADLGFYVDTVTLRFPFLCPHSSKPLTFC